MAEQQLQRPVTPPAQVASGGAIPSLRIMRGDPARVYFADETLALSLRRQSQWRGRGLQSHSGQVRSLHGVLWNLKFET